MYDWWSSSRQYSLLTADVDKDGSLTTELSRSQTLRGRWKARYASSPILQNLLIILVGCVGFILGILVSWEQKPPGSAMNTVPRGISPCPSFHRGLPRMSGLFRSVDRAVRAGFLL